MRKVSTLNSNQINIDAACDLNLDYSDVFNKIIFVCSVIYTKL